MLPQTNPSNQCGINFRMSIGGFYTHRKLKQFHNTLFRHIELEGKGILFRNLYEWFFLGCKYEYFIVVETIPRRIFFRHIQLEGKGIILEACRKVFFLREI